MTFSNGQLEALRAACDAIIPSLERDEDPYGFWARKASDYHVAEKAIHLLSYLDEKARKEFDHLLSLLNSPMLGVTWGGPPRSIQKLSPEQREAVLQSWSASRLSLLRKSFMSLKKLAGILYYGSSDGRKPNPNWEAMGYPGPLHVPPPTQRPIRPFIPNADLVLTCDTVVVGSGAGGGVVAGELAEAGDAVIVIEKGPYVAEDGYTQREAEMMRRLYEAAGALTTHDGGIGVLAGSCLGGGTTVNWAGAFRTPDIILEQWADKHDNPHFTSDAFKRSIGCVAQATHVDTEESPHNAQNMALLTGSQTLGYHVKVIPRNVKGCIMGDPRECGYCGLGCRKGAKMSTLKTYLQRAFNAGAQILADTKVEKVLVESGSATGVQAVYQGRDGKRHTVTVKAKRVVVAAGAIHTPALLHRSGIQHTHLGRHLYLHPTVSVSARYAEPVDPWFGTMMSAVTDEFNMLDGTYGVKLETPPAHPGMMALALPWRSGRHHKQMMLHVRHLASFIVLTRDREGGCVKFDRQGRPVLQYNLSDYDLSHLLRGIGEAARIHQEAGACTIYFPHNSLPEYARMHDKAMLEELLREMPTWGWRPNQFPLFSAHQMGTCRMGGRDADHPVTPEGAVRGTRNLYVADASTFPESSGVNPMLSIQAIAHFVAQGLK